MCRCRSLAPQRAEVIVAGGQILEGVMRAFNIQTLQPCAYALREGVIIDYLREIEAESLPPVPDVEDIRLRDVFGRSAGVSAMKNSTLCRWRHWRKRFSTRSHRFTNSNDTGEHCSPPLALLHDIGYHISHEAHHKHSLYLIKHSEITGFSENEKLMIANIARYHRKALPKDKHVDFMQLNEQDRKITARLGGILRIADALDRGYENHVKDIQFKLNKKNLQLKLVSEQDCTIEREAIEQKKDLFEFAFDCNLIAV